MHKGVARLPGPRMGSGELGDFREIRIESIVTQVWN
jgi:hypothetical protein